MMKITGVTWSGPDIDDPELIDRLPPLLGRILRQANGIILHSGALHLFGACHAPDWHSLRHRWEGDHSLAKLYPEVRVTDVPFAEDQLGDQFLFRDERIIRLNAETGEISDKESSLELFLERAFANPEEYLNVSLSHRMDPGQLLFAWPPFFLEGSNNAKLQACPAGKVLQFHADIARQITSVPDGEKVQFVWKE